MGSALASRLPSAGSSLQGEGAWFYGMSKLKTSSCRPWATLHLPATGWQQQQSMSFTSTSSRKAATARPRASAAPLGNSAGSPHLKANGVKVDGAASGVKVDAMLGNSALRATAAKEDIDCNKELVMTTGGLGNGASAAIARLLDVNVTDSDTCTESDEDMKHKEGAPGAGILSGLKSKIGKLDVEVLNQLRQGRLVENKVVYRQTFVIRSYEVGADKTVSIDTFNNLFQDVALNHVWVSGLAGDGFGATHAMMRNQLIWVVTRMHVQVDKYPTWGDVIEIDSWVGASGKNGMRRDWLVRDYTTGQILARATSTWVMMNKVTRRLSKMPDDVRAEISPWFIERTAMPVEEGPHCKISKLDGSAAHIRSNLTPKRSDLDMNQHVNNVKYIGWMMESLPPELLESHELKTIILEYRKECGQHDTVQALTSPEATDEDPEDEVGVCMFRDPAAAAADDNNVNGSSISGAFPYTAGLNGCGFCEPAAASTAPLRYTHLIRMDMNKDNSEILRGRSIWRSKEQQQQQQQQHNGASSSSSSSAA